MSLRDLTNNCNTYNYHRNQYVVDFVVHKRDFKCLLKKFLIQDNIYVWVLQSLKVLLIFNAHNSNASREESLPSKKNTLYVSMILLNYWNFTTEAPHKYNQPNVSTIHPITCCYHAATTTSEGHIAYTPVTIWGVVGLAGTPSLPSHVSTHCI